MISSGFTRLQADHRCYSKWFENSYIILLLYVDDMLVGGSSMKEIVNLKSKLVKEFSMKDLGPAKKILGMRINRKRKEVVEDITMSDAKLVNVPLGGHFKLSKAHALAMEDEKALMSKGCYMHQLWAA